MEHIENCILKCYTEETDITHVVISEGVTAIGEKAFNGCNNIRMVTLPASVEYIDTEAFADCAELEAIIIPYCIHIHPYALGFEDGCRVNRIISTHASAMDWKSEYFGDELMNGFAYAHYKGIKIEDDIIKANNEYLKEYWFCYFLYQFTDEYLLQYLLDHRMIERILVDSFIDNKKCGVTLRAKLLEYRRSLATEEDYTLE